MGVHCVLNMCGVLGDETMDMRIDSWEKCGRVGACFLANISFFLVGYGQTNGFV